MTISNNEIQAIVEIDGIQSYQLQIPAVITSNFTIGDIVTGVSGANAEVIQTTTLLDTSILIKNRHGFFEAEEALTSAGGVATSNGATFNEKALYNNSDFDIVGGLWTLDTTESQTVKFGGATSAINIYDGGNFSTGNNFSIDITNFGLIQAFFEDGAFLEGLDVRLFIDLSDGNGLEQRWTGKTQNYKKTSKTFVTIKCIDAGKQRNEEMGSDEIPIALNLNYRCKLPYQETNEETFRFDTITKGTETVELDYGFVTGVANAAGGATDPTVILYYDYQNKSNFASFLDSDFNDGYIKIISGAGAGNIYKIYDVFIESLNTEFNYPQYGFSLNTDISELIPRSSFSAFMGTGTSSVNMSVMQIISQVNVYNLSQLPVNRILTATNSLDSRPPTITDDEQDYELSSDLYDSVISNGNQTIQLKGVKEEKNTELFAEKVMQLSSARSITLGSFLYFNFTANIGPLSNVDELVQSGTKVYLDFKTITLKGALLGSFSAPQFGIRLSGYYRDLKVFATDRIDIINEEITDNSKLVSIEKSGADIVVTVNTKGNLDAFEFDNYDNSNNLLSNLTLDVYVSIITGDFDPSYDGEYELDGVSLLYGGDLSLNELSAGCSGENAYDGIIDCTISSDFEQYETITGSISNTTAKIFQDATTSDTELILTDIRRDGPFSFGFAIGENLVGDVSGLAVSTSRASHTGGFVDPLQTLQYLMTNYMGIPESNINTASFTQANEDFDLFPSATSRNAGHQIVAQTDVNKIMKDLLYNHHLGLFYGQDGRYTAENWLPKSVVFSDSATLYDFNATDWESISDISSSTNVKIVNDITLKFDYNESTGEYEDEIRVKRPDIPFDFDLCTEGINRSNIGEAINIHELGTAGFGRTNKISQFTYESKWIKKNQNYDGTQGQGEALAFMRNLMGHINRNLQSVTITLPFTKTFLDLDLLSFISVTEQKLTSGQQRTGWIINRVVDYTSKRLVLKILFDIDLSDPFLVQIGIIQDTFDEPEIIDDDNTVIEVIQDGLGV